jgi:hypothetical protein
MIHRCKLSLPQAIVGAAWAWLGVVATFAHGDTLTFDGPSGDVNPGTPTIEGAFTYEAFSGALYRAPTRGNPAPGIEGRITAEGGVLAADRNDAPGGLFTFDRVDVSQFSFTGIRTIDFTGLRHGAVQAVDALTTTGVDGQFVTRQSVNLNAVPIDELRVRLDGTFINDQWWEAIDNLVLTRVEIPEPATLPVAASLGLAVLGTRRRQSA